MVIIRLLLKPPPPPLFSVYTSTNQHYTNPKPFIFFFCFRRSSNLHSSAMGKQSEQGSNEKKKVKEGLDDSDDSTREAFCKEACDHIASKRVSDRIMPHILNLYGSCATPRDFDIYAPNASFEDPLMHASSLKQIKSAFYSLAKVFSESRIVEYSVEEHEISPGKREILVDNKQYYKFWGKDINMVSLIKLYTERGKVIRHEDWWDKKPHWNRDTVKLPLAGRLVEMARRASMLATHVLMRFGKDPVA